MTSDLSSALEVLDNDALYKLTYTLLSHKNSSIYTIEMIYDYIIVWFAY